MDNLFISIVIPVYNVEKCLSRCLDSVVNQNYKNYEIIIINDGSTDGSDKICQHYENSYSNVIYLRIPNGGVSNARNIGIAHSHGDAVLFIDSDDAVTPNFIESLVVDGINVEEELLIQGCICQSLSGKVSEWKCPDISYRRDDFKKAINDLELFMHGGPTSKLYSLNVIRKNNIFFNPQLHNYEDLVFFLNYIKHINTLRFSSNLGYTYYVQDTGMHLHRSSYVNERVLLDCYLELMKPYIVSPSDNISAYALSLFYRLFRSAFHEGISCVIEAIRIYRHLLVNSTKYLSDKTILLNSVVKFFVNR